MKNSRGFAWVVAVIIGVAGFFVGTFLSFNTMRSEGAEAFQREAMPPINRAMESAFNIQTIAGRYLDLREIESIGISQIVQNIQNAENEADIADYYVSLNRAVWAIYDILATIEMTQDNRSLHGRYHANFLEQDFVLSVSAYNNTAVEFNETLNGGLGFLMRPFLGLLPRFDVVTPN
ncbi:MAG: hypothetical protein FWB98_01395 [Defluviitaleaceae bacterium]|nr:hypothetical protein [Defluviitaleaceae bacterium]